MSNASDKFNQEHVTALRAVAVLLVIFTHYKLFLIKGGFVGVDVFFVISGYVITLGVLFYIEIEKMPFSVLVLNFYHRRILRILPAATVCVIVTLIVGYFVMSPKNFHESAVSAVWIALMSGNIQGMYSSQDYHSASELTKPLLQFWSLGDEEQFYFVQPVLLFTAMVLVWKCLVWALSWMSKSWRERMERLGPRGIAICVFGSLALVSFVWSYYDVLANHVSSYYSPFSRAWELCAGVILALVKTPFKKGVKQVLGPVGIIAILSSAFWFNNQTMFPGPWALVPVLGAVCFILAGKRFEEDTESVVVRWISFRLALYTGLISYSLYLWHWHLLVYTRYYYPMLFVAGERTGWMAVLVPLFTKITLVLISIGVAALSYHFVEKKFQAKEKDESPFGRKLKNKAFVYAGGLCAITCTLAVSAVIIWNAGWPERFGKLIAPEMNISGIELPDMCGKSTGEIKVILQGVGLPRVGANGVVPRVLFAGDSHIEPFMKVLDEESKDHGVAGFVSFRSGSIPVPGLWTSRGGTYEEFTSYYHLIEEYVCERDLKHVVLFGRWNNGVKGDMLVSDTAEGQTDKTDAGRVLEEKLSAFVERMNDRGITVWVMLQVPEHPFHVPNYLASRRGRVEGIPKGRHLANQSEVNEILGRSGARILDPTSFLFGEDGRTRLLDNDGYPMWWDGDHLGGNGAEFVRPIFNELLTEIAESQKEVVLKK